MFAWFILSYYENMHFLHNVACEGRMNNGRKFEHMNNGRKFEHMEHAIVHMCHLVAINSQNTYVNLQ